DGAGRAGGPRGPVPRQGAPRTPARLRGVRDPAAHGTGPPPAARGPGRRRRPRGRPRPRPRRLPPGHEGAAAEARVTGSRPRPPPRAGAVRRDAFLLEPGRPHPAGPTPAGVRAPIPGGPKMSTAEGADTTGTHPLAERKARWSIALI